MYYMKDSLIDNTGLKFIMDNLVTRTSFGLDEKKKIRPFLSSEKQQLIKELDHVEKIINAVKKNKQIYMKIISIIQKFKDLRGSIKKCENGEILDIVDLYEIKYFAFLLMQLLPFYELFGALIDGIEYEQPDEIFISLDPDGNKLPIFQIYDSYSEELKDIRARKRELEDNISSETDAGTIRRLTQERLGIVCLEENEELNVRRELSKELFDYLPLIKKDIEFIGRLDFLIAKAELALKYKGIKPEICNENEINLQGVINPEVSEILGRCGKEFTPVGIELAKGVTIITGANMGGKSVTLKSIVLNLMLGHMGFFVYCSSARFPVFDFISLISGDLQSIARGLSSFGAEIIELKAVLEKAAKGIGLIAIDEFARGTNPDEGYCFVKSLCRHLSGLDSISLISTHYDNIAPEGINHYQVIGLRNADFNLIRQRLKNTKGNSIEVIQEYMDYRLEKVYGAKCVPKDALNIAGILGLQREVIELTEEFYIKEIEHGK